MEIMKNSRRKILLSALLLLVPVVLFAAETAQIRMRGAPLNQLFISEKYGLALLLILILIALLSASKMKRQYRIVMMLVAFIIFGGIVIGVHPSPVCATTKPFTEGMRTPFLAMLIFVGAFTLIANKSFCSTSCPGGALQELLYWLPIVKKGNHLKKIEFKYSNTVRVSVALLFLVVFFTASFSIFEYINYFELFHWVVPADTLLLVTLGVSIVGFSALSLFIYRPFCYFLCPMGLVTWVLEQFSISRIKLDSEKCTSCNICLHKAPCPSVKGILEVKKVRGDCHLCGECIDVCPEDALNFGVRGL